MKIGPLDPKTVAASGGGERKAAGSTARDDGSAEASTKVELSSSLKLLDGDGAEGAFDAQKVERIAQAIRDGQYRVHPEVIADKLIANARELLGKPAN